jgi:hypothetical protein
MLILLLLSCLHKHNEQQHDVYCSLNIIPVIKQVECDGREEKYIQDFGGETWKKRALGKPRYIYMAE